MTNSFAQQRSGSGYNAGLEQDVLPYVTGGYYFGAWVGKAHTRVRFIMARVHKPDFMLRKGFTNNKVTAYALTGDYFVQRSWKGVWLSGGIVYWKNSIQASTRINTADYNNILLNGSIGYNLLLLERLYLSPWAGMHVRVGGPAHVTVDNQVYHPPLLNPEASLKLGWYF